MKIEYISIDLITPYDKNAKQHPEEQINQIAASIRDYGMNDPVAIWGKDNLIVEGHGRYYACKQLGIKDIPVIRLDKLTDEQRKAYTLVHNKLAMETGFDLELLEKEIEEIGADLSQYGIAKSLDEMNINDLDDLFEEGVSAGQKQSSKMCTCPRCGKSFERK